MLKHKKIFGGISWTTICCAIILSIYCLPSSAYAQPLRFLLQRLAQTHPAITAQYEQALASEATISDAESGYFPRISAGVNYGYQESERTGGLSSTGKVDTKPLDTSLSISQNIFQGFSTSASIESAQADFTSKSFQLNAVRQQLFLKATSNYIDLIKQRHLLMLSQQNIQTLQKQVSMETELMSAGTGIAVDVLSAKSRLQLAHERYANFLAGFQKAEASFIKFFGIKPDYRTLRLPNISPTTIPRNLPQAIQTALTNNPSLKSSESQADAAQSQRTVARSGYFPRVDVVASSTYQDSDSALSGKTSNNSLQLRSSWELFSGFSDKAKETTAIHNYQATLASVDNARRGVIETTKHAWAQLSSLQQRGRILQNAVTIAQQVYAARMRLRDIGRETAINVLSAENDLFNAQVNAINVQYNGYLAYYQLLQAIGVFEVSSIL